MENNDNSKNRMEIVRESIAREFVLNLPGDFKDLGKKQQKKYSGSALAKIAAKYINHLPSPEHLHALKTIIKRQGHSTNFYKLINNFYNGSDKEKVLDKLKVKRENQSSSNPDKKGNKTVNSEMMERRLGQLRIVVDELAKNQESDKSISAVRSFLSIYRSIPKKWRIAIGATTAGLTSFLFPGATLAYAGWRIARTVSSSILSGFISEKISKKIEKGKEREIRSELIDITSRVKEAEGNLEEINLADVERIKKIQTKTRRKQITYSLLTGLAIGSIVSIGMNIILPKPNIAEAAVSVKPKATISPEALKIKKDFESLSPLEQKRSYGNLVDQHNSLKNDLESNSDFSPQKISEKLSKAIDYGKNTEQLKAIGQIYNPIAIDSKIAESFTVEIEKGGNVWSATRQLVDNGKITEEQFRDIWKGSKFNKTPISKLGLVHEGDKITIRLDKNLNPEKIEFLNESGIKAGSDQDLYNAYLKSGQEAPAWLKKSVGMESTSVSGNNIAKINESTIANTSFVGEISDVKEFESNFLAFQAKLKTNTDNFNQLSLFDQKQLADNYSYFLRLLEEKKSIASEMEMFGSKFEAQGSLLEKAENLIKKIKIDYQNNLEIFQNNLSKLGIGTEDYSTIQNMTIGELSQKTTESMLNPMLIDKINPKLVTLNNYVAGLNPKGTEWGQSVYDFLQNRFKYQGEIKVPTGSKESLLNSTQPKIKPIDIIDSVKKTTTTIDTDSDLPPEIFQ